MKLKYILILCLLPLFSSCQNMAENIGWTGLIILFVVLLLLFAFMFYLIFTRKKKGEKSLAQFSIGIATMLDKFEHPENKIGALKALVQRINEDEKYKKDTTWKDRVLAKTYLHLATQYHAVGDTENTLDTCTKILDLTPDDAMTLYNRGSIYSNIGESEKALADLNRSIYLVDDYASTYNNRGTVYIKLGKDDLAFADFNKAIELEESATIYLNRGNAHKALGQTSQAKEDYAKALEMCTKNAEVELEKEIRRAMESLSKE